MPKSNLFAWDAARGQLELFASLGIRAALAQEVIKAVEDGLARPKSVESHVIVFVGHQVDEPGRAERRFPTDREAKTRALIAQRLEQMKDGPHKWTCLPQRRLRSDILCHEVLAHSAFRVSVSADAPRGVRTSDSGQRSRSLAVALSRAARTSCPCCS